MFFAVLLEKVRQLTVLLLRVHNSFNVYFPSFQSRVTNHVSGERNFHIFYQLLNTADLHLLSECSILRVGFTPPILIVQFERYCTVQVESSSIQWNLNLSERNSIPERFRGKSLFIFLKSLNLEC